MTKHNKARADDIVAEIRDFTQHYGYAPTIRELAERVGLASTSAVHHHLRALAKAGRITYTPTTARSLRITGDHPSETAEDILFAVMLDRRVGELNPDVQDRIGRYFTGRTKRAA